MTIGSVPPVPRVPFECYGPAQILDVSLIDYTSLINGQKITF
jgi:hypothetical protein